MSYETSQWLNQNTLIGFTEKRGTAWHYRASDQGTETNHYRGPVPVADVHRRLFNWEAVKVPTANDVSGLLDVPGPVWRESTSSFRILRSDTLDELGTFKEGYRVHNYGQWLVSNVATLLDSGLSIGSAGLLRGGRQAWVSVEVPETIVTPEGVAFRPNLLACSSHDGSIATTYKRVVTNVVCDNTLAAGLGESGQVMKYRHSRKSIGRLAEARDALNLVHAIAEDFEAEVRELCSTTVTENQWSDFLNAHAPIPEESGRGATVAENKQAALRNLWENDARVNPWRNTAWGVLQAVNTYTHHVGTVKKGMTRPERNMARAVDGEIDQLDATTIKTLALVRG